MDGAFSLNPSEKYPTLLAGSPKTIKHFRGIWRNQSESCYCRTDQPDYTELMFCPAAENYMACIWVGLKSLPELSYSHSQTG